MVGLDQILRHPKTQDVAQAIGSLVSAVRPLACWLVRYRRWLGGLVAVLIAAYWLFNPKLFMDLWLTRDQQAALAFYQQDYERAASHFRDQRWRAYSHYAAGEFKVAADLYSIFDDVESTFAKANSLAHSRQYYLARDGYGQVLELQPGHEGASQNLNTVNMIIFQLENLAKMQVAAEKGMAGSGGDEDLSEMELHISRDKKDEEEKPSTQQSASDSIKSLSNEIWLEQVQKNPAVFLRKKFYMEHSNAR